MNQVKGEHRRSRKQVIKQKNNRTPQDNSEERDEYCLGLKTTQHELEQMQRLWERLHKNGVSISPNIFEYN